MKKIKLHNLLLKMSKMSKWFKNNSTLMTLTSQVNKLKLKHKMSILKKIHHLNHKRGTQEFQVTIPLTWSWVILRVVQELVDVNMPLFFEHYLFVSCLKPSIIDEALEDPDWVMAMQEELNNFTRNEVWVLEERPQDKNIIGTKWVFQNKQDEQGLGTCYSWCLAAPIRS